MRIRATVELKSCIVTGEYERFSEIDELIARCKANGDKVLEVRAYTIHPEQIKQGRYGIVHPEWVRSGTE